MNYPNSIILARRVLSARYQELEEGGFKSQVQPLECAVVAAPLKLRAVSVVLLESILAAFVREVQARTVSKTQTVLDAELRW